MTPIGNQKSAIGNISSEDMMADIEWATSEEVPVKEKFGGTFRVRTLWDGPKGEKAQLVEISPGGCWEGIDVHEPGPEEVYVVSGVFNDGVRDYPAGTFIHNAAGSSHVPQSKTGCTIFIFYPEG